MNYGLTDLGSYWCQVQNSYGFGTSKQITLGLQNIFNVRSYHNLEFN